MLESRWVNKDRLYLTITLSILFLLDIAIVVGLLWHGKANFTELIKHLK
jgi:hypothetical protein